MNRRPPYSKSRWTVARERLQLAAEQPPPAGPDARPLGAFVPGALKGLKLDAQAQVAQIAAAWPELVGPQLAANTRPARLENKILLVHVTHPAWLMELRGAPAAEILARLQARFGKTALQNLRFAVADSPA